MTTQKKTPVDVQAVRLRLVAIEKQLNSTFVQRHEAIRVIMLGALAQQNYMLIGPPGTAKTSVIDCFVKHVDTPKRFKILMGRFTQPEHVVGVLDIAAFKAGKYSTVTAGMLTDVPFPILDETLKTSDGCMNAFLGILGPEREFQGKRTENVCVGGATNWPEVDALSKHVEALFDRFLLRCSVHAVDRGDKVLRRALYRATREVRTYTPAAKVTVDELKAAAGAAADVEISDEIIDLVDSVVARLLAPKRGSDNREKPSDIEVSDRRATQLQDVLRANAWLEGRDAVSIEDFEVLRHGLWSKRKDIETVNAVLDTVDQAVVQDLVREIDIGRGAYRNLQSTGFGAVAVNEVTEQIKSIAYDVKEMLERPVFTKKGRSQVRQAMQALRKDFEDLNARAKQAAGR